MKIGEASREVGVTPRSLRYYEDQGLIVPGRCENGYRDYCRSTIDRAAVVRSLLAAGLPVRLISQVLSSATDASHGGSVDHAGHLAAVEDYRHRLARRIDVLRAQQDSLDEYLRQARVRHTSHAYAVLSGPVVAR
ncbi:MAG TPA: MerR family transcriptional regulator [Actinocatenispora sp.]